MIYKEIQFEGTRILYRCAGAGEPVLLMHGFGEDSRVWDSIMGDISNHNFIFMDLPGFGLSELIEPYTIDRLAESACAVLDAEGIDRCIALGHSMGGYVALSIAAQQPDRLNALGLIHSHPYADENEKKLNRSRSIDYIRTHGIEPFVKQLIPVLFSKAQRVKHGKEIDLLIARGSRYCAEAYISALAAMRDREDYAGVLADFPKPVLFVVGSEDEAIPSSSSLSQLSLPESGMIHILQGVGHMSMFEDPERTKKIVYDFLYYLRNQNLT
jgi:pimeloyl-ACP methyl ester carboxylesterase